MLIDLLTRNAEHAFNSDWEEDFRPRIKRVVSQWATEERIIAEGTGVMSSTDMRYEHRFMPHCEEIMDCVDNPAISEIVMWMGIRDGKTNSVCMNVIGRCVTDDPGNICSVHPIDDDAARFSEGDVEPTIKGCLEGYFVEKKSRDAGRTIEFKKFKGGWIRIFSAGSASKFRGVAIKVMCLHELDALNVSSIFKAMGRVTGFPDAIIIKESTGTIAAEIKPDGTKVYRSNIEEAYDQGDKRKWFCACRVCGERFTIKYEQFKWARFEMAKTEYECEVCSAMHSPKQWETLVQGIKYGGSALWYPTAGLTEAQVRDIDNTHKLARAINPTVRSYWRNGFNSLLPHHSSYASKLHEFVAQGEAAQTSMEAKKIWTQEKKAELWNPELETEAPPAWKPIFDGREDYELVPAPASLLTGFVDVQRYRLEIGWRAWGREEESWGMAHTVIQGYTGDITTWAGLVKELSRRWEHESGAELYLEMAFVDGGKWPDEVYKFFVLLSAYFAPTHPLHSSAHEAFKNCTPEEVMRVYGHCRASRGMGQAGHPIITKKMQTVGKVLKGHHIGTWVAKDRIYERLRLHGASTASISEALRIPDTEIPNLSRMVASTETARNSARAEFAHFNKTYTEEFCQQLTSEQVQIVWEKGIEVRKYVNPKSVRNEALDIEVGNLAAVRLHPRNWDALEEEIKRLAETKKKPTQKQQQGQGRATTGQGGANLTSGLKW